MELSVFVMLLIFRFLLTPLKTYITQLNWLHGFCEVHLDQYSWRLVFHELNLKWFYVHPSARQLLCLWVHLHQDLGWKKIEKMRRVCGKSIFPIVEFMRLFCTLTSCSCVYANLNENNRRLHLCISVPDVWLFDGVTNSMFWLICNRSQMELWLTL